MRNNILITRPDHDPTTRYLSCFAQQVIEITQKYDHQITDLKGKRANKNEFESIIKKTSPDFIFLNGHGDENSVSGYDNEVILEGSRNDRTLKDKIAYALSCSSAKRLGNSAVKAGAKTYVGYDEEFFFVFDQAKMTRPQNDKTARFFLEPSNLLAIAIIKGNSVSNSCKRSQENFRRNIEDLQSSESPEAD